jgi:branched-chain amino acid transport system substrate-binding protein
VLPLTKTLGVLGRGEVAGFELARDEINKAGGILGRPVELVIEDDTDDVGVGVQKAQKLLEREKVDVMYGAINSGIVLAMMQVTAQHRTLHLVPGAHGDPITGSSCKWNVFRICNTTRMEANAIADTLMKKFGKRWYFITPDYAFGHASQKAFAGRLTAAGGTVAGADLVPHGTSDFSAYLIKAAAAKPDVLMVLEDGQDMVNFMKQIVQFGLDKKFAVAGGQQSYENFVGMPPEARIGWWVLEWYWNVPGVKGLPEFVEKIRKRTGLTPSAHHWFAYVGLYTYALLANEHKSLDAMTLARAIEGWTVPPEIALQPHSVTYRKGDHQLLSQVYIGTAKRGDQDPADLFDVSDVLLGKDVVEPLEETGCKIVYPA